MLARCGLGELGSANMALRRHRTYSIALLASLLFVSVAKASPYRLYPVADATSIGVGAAVWLVPEFARSTFVSTGACPCSSATINPLDRGAAGVQRPGVKLASDIAIVSAYSLAVALTAFEVVAAREGFDSFLTDMVILAQALSVGMAVNELVKIAVTRPRPLTYDRPAGDPVLQDPENYVSFYSAHTSGAFAVGLAYAQTFALRHPRSPMRFVVYGAAVAIASGIGALRVLAGQHFPSDVLVGAAAGSVFGMVLPWLHVRSPGSHVSLQVAPKALSVSLVLSMP